MTVPAEPEASTSTYQMTTEVSTHHHRKEQATTILASPVARSEHRFPIPRPRYLLAVVREEY